MLLWGIIGVGRAGRARAGAIAADPRSEAPLGFRGQPEAVGLTRAADVDALIQAVDAVAVCSADATHPALVRRALNAGRHVLCEYPLAPTAAEAAELYAFADAQERVLHVEHIELLGGAAAWWRQADLGVVSEGTVRFSSSRVDVPTLDANLARLHRIVDILGLPTALRVSHRDASTFQGTLRFGSCEIGLDFVSGHGLPRRTTITLQCDRGRAEQINRAITLDGEPVTLPQRPGLFFTDQCAATAAILDGAPPYISRARVVAVLALRDALRAAVPGSWQAFSPPG